MKKKLDFRLPHNETDKNFETKILAKISSLEPEL